MSTLISSVCVKFWTSHFQCILCIQYLSRTLHSSISVRNQNCEKMNNLALQYCYHLQLDSCCSLRHQNAHRNEKPCKHKHRNTKSFGNKWIGKFHHFSPRTCESVGFVFTRYKLLNLSLLAAELRSTWCCFDSLEAKWCMYSNSCFLYCGETSKRQSTVHVAFPLSSQVPWWAELNQLFCYLLCIQFNETSKAKLWWDINEE